MKQLIPLFLVLLTGCAVNKADRYAQKAKMYFDKAQALGANTDSVFQTRIDSVKIELGGGLTIKPKEHVLDTNKLVVLCDSLVNQTREHLRNFYAKKYEKYDSVKLSQGWDAIQQSTVNDITNLICPLDTISIERVVKIKSQDLIQTVIIKIKGIVAAGTFIEIDAPEVVQVPVKVQEVDLSTNVEKKDYMTWIIVVLVLIGIIIFMTKIRRKRK